MESRSIFSPPRSMAANDLRNNTPMSPQTPACVQNAMFSKERKPFTYTPGGLDLSEIRSEKMAKRLMRNAMSPGVQERPKAPTFTPPIDPSAPKSCHYFNLPVAVFPCIQIPPNPKELLRRTSGPYSRSESMEPSTPNTPIVIENKVNGKIVEGHIKIKLKPAEKVEEVKDDERKPSLDLSKVAKDDNTNMVDNVETKENITNHVSSMRAESVSSIDDRLELKINGSSESSKEVSNCVSEVPKVEDVPKYNGFLQCNNNEDKTVDLENEEDAYGFKISNLDYKTNVSEDNFESKEHQHDVSGHTEITEKANDISESKNAVSENYKSAIPEYENKFSEPQIDVVENKNSISETNGDVQESEANIPDNNSNENKTIIVEDNSTVSVVESSAPEYNSDILQYKSSTPEYINNVPEYTNVDLKYKNNIPVNKNFTPELKYDISEETEDNQELLKDNLPSSYKKTTEEPLISVETSESILNPLLEIIDSEIEKCVEESSHKNKEEFAKENGFSNKESPNMLNVEFNRINDSPREEERVISPMRRSMETIKGLSDDLDNLPTLNICTKRFSFLRDSPERNDYQKEDEDPFKILTGIPPKISLIDRPETNNYRNYDRQPPWKAENDKPTQKENQSDTKTLSPPWKDDIRAPSPFTKEDGFWKKGWNSLSRKDSLTIKDILKDDPEPAWKKEIREIALRKAKEETKEYANLQPKELPSDDKDYLQTIKLGEEPKYLISEPPAYQPPWNVPNNNYYKPVNNYEQPNPTWSQTLRPKTWKEREAERKQNEIANQPIKSVTNNFIKNQNGFGSPVRKTPEITVEVVNQPAYVSQPVPSNSYIYPWETSSESSTAFSPEPRTPTPQSRNSPFTLNPNGGYVQSAVAREYGTLGFQPKRRLPGRSCPIQSRSFKYLQLLTGTEDSYEDDEPFIPQPPQHAHPRPGNL